MSERYNVVLEGRVRSEASREAVIPDLAALVGRDAGFARELLSGRSVVLKSGVAREEADEALAALTRIGVLASVERAPDLQIDADLAARMQVRSRPALWNPNAAACWSLIFTPLFGATLHLLNWRSMQRAERMVGAKAWLVVSAVLFLLTMVLSITLPAASNALRVGSFVYLLIWYFAAARPQVKFVKLEYGRDYVRRAWWVPLLIAIVVVVASMIVAGVLSAYFGNGVVIRSGTTSL